MHLPFFESYVSFVACPFVIALMQIRIGQQIVRLPVISIFQHRLLQCRARRRIVPPGAVPARPNSVSACVFLGPIVVALRR